MTPHTLPGPLDALTRGRAADEFRLRAPAEIRALLERLVDARALLHLLAPDGAAYTTTLRALDVRRDLASFTCDADDPQLQRLLGADEVTVVGYLDAIKLQFELRGAMLVNGSGGATLAAPLPSELLRLRRRASLRVRPAAQQPATARLRHPAADDVALALRVLDVSAGGVALLLPDDVPAIAPGARLREVIVDLDAATCVQADLEVQHVTAIHPESGGARLGCSWRGLTGSAARALRAFIDRTQQRQRPKG